MCGGPNATLINKVYLLQKKIVRIILNKGYMSYTTPLFCQLGIIRVIDLHEHFLALYMFKCKLGGGLGRVNHYYDTRQHNDAPVTYQRLTLTQHSAYYLAPRVWNALPKQIRDAPSLSIFKKHIKLLILGRYQVKLPRR